MRSASPPPVSDDGASLSRLSDGHAGVPKWFSEVRCGTAVALALGLSEARHNLGQEHWIVAVVSANSLFRSLSHELIEQLQGVEARLMIVVVDNGQGLTTPDASPVESNRLGQFDLLDTRWLSELGLPCSEPVSGDSPIGLLSELQQIVQMQLPAVLHVRGDTKRFESELPTESHGRGLLRLSVHAEKNGGEAAPSMLDAVSDELLALARTDPRVVAVVQDSLQSQFAFCRKQPDRSYLLPPAGRAPFTRTRGLALGGCRPFIVVSGRYLQQTLDQLAGELCASGEAVTLIVVPAPDRMATLSESTMRPTSEIAYLRLLPNTVVAVPSDECDMRRMLGWSLSHPSPVVIQLSRRIQGGDSRRDGAAGNTSIESGRSVVLSEGVDVALLALGSQVPLAEEAARLLSEQGVSVEVVDVRFVTPLDRGLLRRLGDKVGGFVTLEEEASHGGFGAAVLEQLAADGISTPVFVSGQGTIAANAVCANGPDDVIREIVRQATDLVNHAAGVGGFYGTSPRREIAGGSVSVAPPDFSPLALEREKKLVSARVLSRDVETWFAIYSQAGERRRFLWQWCEQGAELTTLPSVPPELFQHVCQTKVLSIMLCVLLDDVADQKGREKFLEVLLRIVDDQPTPDLSGLTPDEQFYAVITRQLSDIYHNRVRKYPCHAAYADLLRYDQLQYFNTMRYSQLLNQNLWLLNPVEHDLYLPHAMDMMSFATIDLMCLPSFSCRELGRLREALWFLQCMGRVGNLLCTWRREIGQEDFTSGVFARAIAQGDLTVEQLRTPDPLAIETAILKGGHERYFLRRWGYYRDCFLTAAQSIESVDMLRLLEGNERFFRMHLASRGLI
jgi:deoxyxylulose-5-phosphate synthase